ncbi:MAG: hypothetical protein AAB403_22120 [Planctomycetota bacterium]
MAEKDFEIEVLKYERDHPGCRGTGEVRLQFTPAYKDFIEECRARHSVTLERAASILQIPLDTLKKFSRYTQDRVTAAGSYPERLPAEVIDLANEYLRSGKGTKSVKGFCERHPELLARLGMNYRQVLGWLGELGFVSPRGIFLKNTGLDKILRFKPNQVWGSDGKKLTIVLNGEVFPSLWQCLIDGKTTVIVGGVVRDEENTQNLLDAIRDSKAKTGVTPMAIVLDNRLSENLPAIRPFLDEHGIEIVKIFPGNSKSNGITEENFNVYDRWVGTVEITGATPEQLARSIQQALVEVFTQMRGHKPSKALSFKSPKEAMNESTPATPEEEAVVREKLHALATRLKNEQAQPLMTEQKKAAIEQAIEKTSPPQPEVFAAKLQDARYTPDLILQSVATLEKQRQENPQKKLGHAYFGGILRNLANQRGIECLYTSLARIYANHWDTMGRITDPELAESLRMNPEGTCTRLASDFVNMPIPAMAQALLVDLKNVFMLASRGSCAIATKLRERISATVLQSKRATVQRRETLLCRLFEWENFIRMADCEGGWCPSPVGHA